MIVTRNYGQAGALEYWRESYRLPPVVSGHNSYWFWQGESFLGRKWLIGKKIKKELDKPEGISHTKMV